MKSIAADTSFYSCFFCYIKDINHLYNFLNHYLFYIGPQIKIELPEKLRKDPIFNSRINYAKFDYYELMKPYLKRDISHATDGEYEAIGLAYNLDIKNELKYLIIDDRKPHNFVKMHFKHLDKYLVGTIGFIRDCCCNDNYISQEEAINLLNHIKFLVKNSTDNKRPCSMDKKKYISIIDPTIDIVRSWDDGRL